MFCLGATKSGTSWLWNHLVGHPDCHFRTIKEYHYFFIADAGTAESAIAEGQRKIARQREKITTLTGRDLAYGLRHLADLLDWQDVLARQDLDPAAYLAFLREGRGNRFVVGDVTPAYGLLSGSRLQQIAALAPDTRFVYLLRDPLGRAWSHIRMVAAQIAGTGGDVAAVARGMIDRLVAGSTDNQSRWLAERGNYAGILPKIDRALKRRPVLIQFYEDLLTPPGVERLHAFLGVGDHPAALGKRVYSGVSVPLEPADRARLLYWLRPQYDYAASRIAALPDVWRQNMELGVA